MDECNCNEDEMCPACDPHNYNDDVDIADEE